ncbi:hypothetical protein MC885_002854 [Smutsia gigantea]|nr:hypothetical protein MC885_002854 [Smutsia gigantea]
MNGQVPRILAPSPTFYIAKPWDKRRRGSGAPSSAPASSSPAPMDWN